MTRVVNHQVDLPEVSATSRRRLLTSLLAGGAAVVAAPFLAGRASAEEIVNAPRDPKDFPALNEALRRERQMAATYKAAAAKASGDEKFALTLLLDHHDAYVDVIKAYLSTNAVSGTEAPLASPTGSFASIAPQMAALENETLAAHTARLGTLVGIDAAKLIASIITVEARHAAALSLLGGASPLAAAGS
jgi:hypothetical protein